VLKRDALVYMNVTTRFTEEMVSLAKSYSDDADEEPAPQGGGSFTEYAMISLHGLRIFLDETYKMTIDRLEVMPPILDVIGFEPHELPHYTTLNKWHDRIKMMVWRVLLRHSAQLHDPSPRAAVDATYYERSPASKHYCDRTNYRVQTIEATKLVDTETQAILDVHCTTTREGSDAEVCLRLARRYPGELISLAADKGYDCNWLREDLRNDLTIRPLIKHCINKPYDYAHNARINDDLYNQRSMTETVNSSVKRLYGATVRAREWYREFREIVLMCLVYNVNQYVTP
jgi:IS5 family transposase